MKTFQVDSIPEVNKQHTYMADEAMRVIREFQESDAKYVLVVDGDNEFCTNNDMRRSFQYIIQKHNIAGIKTYLRDGKCYLGKVKK